MLHDLVDFQKKCGVRWTEEIFRVRDDWKKNEAFVIWRIYNRKLFKDFFNEKSYKVLRYYLEDLKHEAI